MAISLEALNRDYPEYLDIKWTFITDYYDGPMHGMVVTDNGRRLWAKMVTDPLDDIRIYSLLELTEQTKTYWDQVKSDYERYIENAETFSECHKFYDKYPVTSLASPEGLTVGWFSSLNGKI